MKSVSTAFLGVFVAVFTSSCGGGSGSDDCSDGVDNDGDGFFDSLDPACIAGVDREAPDPVVPACNDGEDNDNDGFIDVDDTGCTDTDDNSELNEPLSACRDGIDNDDDGLSDYPNDPGCEFSLDDIEEDGCPESTSCPACANGLDDDDDGLADFPEDPGCNGASDSDEYNAVQTDCGAVAIKSLPEDGIVMGQVAAGGLNELISTDCGGSGSEQVYMLELDAAVALDINTNFPETTLDTVVYLREECRMDATELGCSDDDGGALSSRLILPRVEPGSYYLIIDAHDNGSSGSFKLSVSQYIAVNEACDPATDTCAPGLFCRSLNDGDPTLCLPPACSDGVDNDDDSKIDFPNEPGCANAADEDEDDACPNGVNCPQCSDGDDNDNDDLVDYPEDTSCTSAASNVETDCEGESAVLEVTGPMMTGTTVDAGNNFTPSCSTFSTAADVVYSLYVPGNLTAFQADTNNTGFDTVLHMKAGTCSNMATQACDDDGGDPGSQSKILLTSLPAGQYFIIVDGYSANQGMYQFHVSGTIAAGQPCLQSQINAGIFSCAMGTTCMAGMCQ